jgi:flagellar protein FliO/FliZ
VKIKGKIAFVIITLVVLVGISLLSSAILEEQPDNGGKNATAVQPGVKTIPEMPDGDSYSLLKSLMALTFVLGLIFLAAYMFKRFTGMKTPGLRSRRVPIQMVGTLPLGDKKFLAVVEIQGKHYFIGISQNAVNMLSELDLDADALEPPGEEAGNHDFAAIFSKARSLLNSSPRHPMRMKK